LEESVKGIIEGCNQLEIPVVSGNVSLYNQFAEGEGILPTPVIGMIGVLDSYYKASSIAFSSVGDNIWLIGETKDEKECPVLDWEKEKALHQFLQDKISDGSINSSHDLSEGGLLIALAESVMAGNLGAAVELTKADYLRLNSLLFGESQSRAIVTTSPNIQLTHSKLKIEKIGQVISDKKLKVDLKGFGCIIDTSKETLISANQVKL
jgi:phosphoribosylformylglycinamidine synthase